LIFEHHLNPLVPLQSSGGESALGRLPY